MAATPDPLLTVSDVRRDFGGVRAVDGATFTALRGRITGLIGPNGAGKSTLMGVVAGAIKPSAGRIEYDGADVTGLPPHRIARRGMVRTFQLSAEFARLTVLENLLVAAPAQRGESLWGAELGRLYWGAGEDVLVGQARAVLDRFSMAPKEDELAGNLSGGQKRLREIERYLMDLRDEGLSMVMVEHELSVVERVCDPVVVMAQGRVIAEGAMADVRTRQEVLDAYLIG